jgi:hypothetical protein
VARIRTIKPEFFTSEDIVNLTPIARLLYIATWCEADKEGRLTWKPMTFKLRYFPGDNCDIHALCKELVDAGMVKLYGDGLAFIPQFGKHQHVNPRESASILPEPKGSRVGTRHDASARVNSEIDPQVGREGKGKEGNTRDASSFDTFWTEYPNRTAKANAVKAWGKIPAELHSEIMEALEIQKCSPAWTKDNGQFIPHAATWLNGRRWEDQPANVRTQADAFAGAL